MEELHDENKCSKCRKKKIDCDICWDNDCFKSDEEEKEEIDD